jgi:hypothetical protein
MSTDDPAPPRPFSTIPDRPPLREVRVDPETDGAMKQAALEAGARNRVNIRADARADALTAVAKARARMGVVHSNWTPAEADVVHAITDLLLHIQELNSPSRA